MTGNIRGQLEKARLELLDLSSRNRLLHTPLDAAKPAARAIRVRDELASEVLRLLFTEGKALTFAPGTGAAGSSSAEDADTAGLPQPDDNEAADERGVKSRHRDTRLQTALTSQGLQKRLLKMYYDARTFAEEQGVNILYLALGFLEWVDEADPRKPSRCAPLVLVPASIERQSAADKFRIRWYEGEDPGANLTLEAKLDGEFKIRMPEFPDVNAPEFSLGAYFDAVEEAVRNQPGWRVRRDDILLGFFSFAKFLMYRDLDPVNWPEGGGIDEHPLVSGLLGGEAALPPPSQAVIGEDALLDPHLPVEDLGHVVDADSSQTLAIHEARQGANLVIQGPPGTGKSQTISNLIAAAVLDGKKVLFLAEKMAALEVVKRRLDHIGLGPVCLEMHSNKVQKRAVLDELGRTLALPRPSALADPSPLHQSLQGARDALNRHCDRMHRKAMPGEVSAYESMGVLTRLRNRGNLPPAPGIELDRPETWTPAERIRRKNTVAQLAAWIDGHGLPAQHPWRDTACPPMLRADADLLLSRLQPALDQLDAAQRAAQTFGHFDNPETAWRIAGHLRGNPGLPSDSSIRLPAWKTRAADIAELIRRGGEWLRLRSELEPIVAAPAAWDQDLRTTRHNLALHGDSFFAFLFGSFRQAKTHLASLLRDPVQGLPPGAAARIALVDRIMAAQQARAHFRELESLGGEAFGSLWRGEASDWPLLERIATWASKDRVALEYLPHRDAAVAAFDTLDRCRQSVAELVQALRCSATESTFDGIRARLQGWLADPEGLSRWTSFHAQATEARTQLGLGAFVDAMCDGRIPTAQALDRFAYTYHNAMLRHMAAADPDLARFDGATQDRVVNQFANLDLRLLERNRAAVIHKHYASIPRVAGPVGALGVITAEIAKKRRHLPLRQLIRQSVPALQALKPVFLMSPLSVAQFLEPGAVEFDLLVIDEASQIEPVDALGAMSRCKQAVVVGDDKQLPPTRFFSRIMGGEEEESGSEESTTAAGDLESILGLCRARGFGERMLRWHYRSRHESLIAVSNHEFYGNRLYIVPSPVRDRGGLRLHHSPDCVYEPGVGVNRAEARRVAQAVMRHATAEPHHSLGVGAFSIRQRDAILEELEVLRRAHPEAETFFGSSVHPAEPFFVKNLENVQGDERDIIFISVGYGRDANGVFAMRLGALNTPGGERRLNVLISRARLRCEVFSPILAGDIDPDRARGRGVTALRTFLQFAERGELPAAAADAPDETASAAKMVEEVATVLRNAGHEVRSRYGLAGLFVELAVVDPADPKRLVLGIEIDGDEYRKARSARDRDRLRASVLARQGWHLYRIWSADWYQRPEEQASKLLAAVTEAQEKAKQVSEPPPQQPPSQALTPVDESTPPAQPVFQQLVGIPYVEASLSPPGKCEFEDVTIYTIVEMVRKVVTLEGPVHESEIIARIRSAFGLARAGSRVQQMIRAGIDQCEGIEALADSFYAIPGKPVEPRDRTEVMSSGLRKPEMIAAAEWDAAILLLLRAHLSASRTEIPLEVARILGFRQTSSVIRGVIEERVSALLAASVLLERNGMVAVA
jgi:hypothetical protein